VRGERSGRPKRTGETTKERGRQQENEGQTRGTATRKTGRHTQVRRADSHRYGVATVSRIDKIIGLFCRISSLL